jgi:hypothetical protein
MTSVLLCFGPLLIFTIVESTVALKYVLPRAQRSPLYLSHDRWIILSTRTSIYICVAVLCVHLSRALVK